MEAIGDLLKKIVKERNLGNEQELLKTALHDPDVQAFLKANEKRLNKAIVQNSMANIYEYYAQKHSKNQVLAGYAPQLFLNGKVIDVRYTPTQAKIVADQQRAAKRRLHLIDLPAKLHDVNLSDLAVTDDRQQALTLIYAFKEISS